jgi:hypothetical protein
MLIARYSSLVNPHAELFETTWDNWFEELRRPAKFLGDTRHPGWSPITLDPPVRKNENVRVIHAIVLDYDKGVPRIDEAIRYWSEFDGFVHTTRSHAETCHRYRVILPLTRSVTPAEFVIVRQRLIQRATKAGHVIDLKTGDPARFWFMPGAVDESAPETWRLVRGYA